MRFELAIPRKSLRASGPLALDYLIGAFLPPAHEFLLVKLQSRQLLYHNVYASITEVLCRNLF